MLMLSRILVHYYNAFPVSERHRQFPWRQFCFLQRKLNDLVTDFTRDAFPDMLWFRGFIFQSSLAALKIQIIPTVECGAGNIYWPASVMPTDASLQPV